MATDKKSVLLYCDLIHTVEKLSNENAGILFKHYLRYVNDKNPEPPTELIDLVFEPIKQQLKRDLKEWEKTKEGYSKGGKASAEKRSRLKQVEDSSSKSTVSVTVTDTVTVNVNDIYFKDLPNSSNFETICRQTGLTKDFLLSKIQLFKPYARVNYPNFNEFCDHFKSWVLKTKTQQAKEFKPLSKELK